MLLSWNVAGKELRNKKLHRSGTLKDVLCNAYSHFEKSDYNDSCFFVNEYQKSEKIMGLS
ncbi:MAG: hypothetical protein K1X92_01220 [Bacteroidia bacterium]|nr:hypothetical protein [Bacteroidia bacterium]